MMEMLAVLQEFQSKLLIFGSADVPTLTCLHSERKASKSSARSAAFQKEKETLFAAARKKAEDTVRQGMESL